VSTTTWSTPRRLAPGRPSRPPTAPGSKAPSDQRHPARRRLTAVLDEATAEELRRHWDEGWNAGDLATIMAPFAPGVVFSSPFVARLTGDQARTTIDGHDALRAYVDHA